MAKREIVLDTETTGLDPWRGHRVIEIGCLELVNHMPTGKVFHKYINPERDVPIEAYNVHGLSQDFLKDHPLFEHVVEEFIEFIQDDHLVIHNADFDMKFLNYELGLLAKPLLPKERAVDTLRIARRKFPGAPASLDALCKRFKIDNSQREKHGALLDAELLADVYLELMGGRQPDLGIAAEASQSTLIASLGPRKDDIQDYPIKEPSDNERQAHQSFLKKIANNQW